MISKADDKEDLESLEDESDKMAQISPRAEIEDHEGNVIKQENGKNLRVKLRNKKTRRE